MKITVNRAILIKRYKRFLTDIKLPNGETTTIHCANTGAMTGCACPNDEVWYSTSSNAKRKYPFSWEINHSQTGHWICVNTLRANQVVEEAILNGAISELQGYETLKREVKYGDENSKIDFYLQSDGKPDTYVEVKSVTLLSDESVSENPNTCINDQREITNANQHQGYFPDAVSLRGQKHLRELSTLAQQGHRAVLLFAILHSGINSVKPAAHIDPNYAKLLSQAKKDGVEILAYKANFSLQETSQENVISIELSQPINVDIS